MPIWIKHLVSKYFTEGVAQSLNDAAARTYAVGRLMSWGAYRRYGWQAEKYAAGLTQ